MSGSLRLNGSTSGFSEITAPDVAGDQTFTLPAVGGTLSTFGIRQIVQGGTSGQVNIDTLNYTDTGLTATITPSSSSSKILVIIDQQIQCYTTESAQGCGIKVFRDSTVIDEPVATNAPLSVYISLATGPINLYTRYPRTLLDSPNSTEALTYKTQGRPTVITGSGSLQCQSGQNAVSNIYLIEVAS